MEQVETNKIILDGVVALCERCDAECPINRKQPELGEGMPHCYKGSAGRVKFNQLVINIAYSDITEDQGEQLDIEFNRRTKNL